MNLYAVGGCLSVAVCSTALDGCDVPSIYAGNTIKCIAPVGGVIGAGSRITRGIIKRIGRREV